MSGKLYFDAYRDLPDGVFYWDGHQDILGWVGQPVASP